MDNTIINREHFNLYYIFLEDKQNCLLSFEKAGFIIEKINKNLNYKIYPIKVNE